MNYIHEITWKLKSAIRQSVVTILRSGTVGNAFVIKCVIRDGRLGGIRNEVFESIFLFAV